MGNNEAGKSDELFRSKHSREMSLASHLTRAGRLSAPVKAALAKNLIHDRSPVCDLYDLDALRGRFNEVQTALPNWNHAVAIKVNTTPFTTLILHWYYTGTLTEFKTNPIAGVLLEAKKAGLGAEAASMGEMQHALNIGFDPAKEGFHWSVAKAII